MRESVRDFARITGSIGLPISVSTEVPLFTAGMICGYLELFQGGGGQRRLKKRLSLIRWCVRLLANNWRKYDGESIRCRGATHVWSSSGR